MGHADDTTLILINPTRFNHSVFMPAGRFTSRTRRDCKHRNRFEKFCAIRRQVASPSNAHYPTCGISISPLRWIGSGLHRNVSSSAPCRSSDFLLWWPKHTNARCRAAYETREIAIEMLLEHALPLNWGGVCKRKVKCSRQCDGNQDSCNCQLQARFIPRVVDA